MSTPSAFVEPRPRDFTARLERGGHMAWAPRGKRHLGRRMAVLAAAMAVPAMAAPGEWGALEAPGTPAAIEPMAFETPGDSFPGSAFYYLADEPYLPAQADRRPAATSGYALPAQTAGRIDARLRAGIDTSPVARSLLVSGSPTDRSRALKCMTMAIYYEAATEPDAGQRAVAQVILNRVAHPTYPDTVCGVVFQGSERTTGCQFTFTCDGSLARAPARMWWDRAEAVARAALAGAVYAPVGLATHYHTVQVHPYWADSLQSVGTIGAHIFYRWRGAAGRASAFSDRYLGGEPIAAPAPRVASADQRPAEADPLALARSFEAGLRTAAAAVPAAPAPSPAYAAEVEARGGDALFRLNAAPATGQVREEYARSGQWLRDPSL